KRNLSRHAWPPHSVDPVPNRSGHTRVRDPELAGGPRSPWLSGSLFLLGGRVLLIRNGYSQLCRLVVAQMRRPSWNRRPQLLAEFPDSDCPSRASPFRGLGASWPRVKHTRASRPM